MREKESGRRRRRLYLLATAALTAFIPFAFASDLAGGWLRVAGALAVVLLVNTAWAALTGRPIPWGPASCQPPRRAEEAGCYDQSRSARSPNAHEP